MARSSLESGSFSFLKKDRKASNSYCILEILITNNSRCSRPRSRSSNHIYRLKLRLYSQSLPRLPNAMRQNRLRTSIPLTCRPHPSCFPSLIISRRPVSRITVIIRTVRCRARPILDSRSQWKKCYAGGSRSLRRTCQPLTWSTWRLSITHSTPRSVSSPLSTHNKPTSACYVASWPSATISTSTIKWCECQINHAVTWWLYSKIWIVKKVTKRRRCIWRRASVIATLSTLLSITGRRLV